jgi:beta-xylosidase
MHFPFHPVRHGTVLPITQEEMSKLVNTWGATSLKATSQQVKPINMIVNAETGTVELPVKPDTDLTRLDPGLESDFDLRVTPTGPQDFTHGPVAYRVGKKRVFQVSAVKNHNPALAGYYADPDVLYSHQTGRFYLYPTSDGFNGWSGTFFKTFSSPDLVHWTDEGVILDLKRDVKWADRNAWAPCIIEKKAGDGYRYFYYFTAAQKIGVAISDSPTGPFLDSGTALIDFRPDSVGGGQEIDPEVFHDPESGQDYLYWGNGYMAVAQLNRDMTSIEKSSIKVITPDRTFREGATVFYRQGLYYFLWSQDDTRSPNYRVRYATSHSPTGPLTIPQDNLVIAKDEGAGIYGTGHNSVIQMPGRDEWYIVYHRFNYPKGISMGGDAGFHREVCIDRMKFDDAGRIVRVTPTHKGIDPVTVGK